MSENENDALFSKENILAQTQESESQKRARLAFERVCLASLALMVSSLKSLPITKLREVEAVLSLGEIAWVTLAAGSDTSKRFSSAKANYRNPILVEAQTKLYGQALKKEKSTLRRRNLLSDANIKKLLALGADLAKGNYSDVLHKWCKAIAPFDISILDKLDIQMELDSQKTAVTLTDLTKAANTLKDELKSTDVTLPFSVDNSGIPVKDISRELKDLQDLQKSNAKVMNAARTYDSIYTKIRVAERAAIDAIIAGAETQTDAEGNAVKVKSSQELADGLAEKNLPVLSVNPEWPLLFSLSSVYTTELEELNRDNKVFFSKAHYRWEANPSYTKGDEDWYFRFVHDKLDHSDKENKTPIYTKASETARKAHKRDAIYDLIEMLPALQRKWRDDLLSKDAETRVKAMMLDTLYWASCRSGHRDGNTGGETTYGLTVWRRSHVSVKPSDTHTIMSRVDIKYQGKDNQPQHHTFIPGKNPMPLLLAKHFFDTAFYVENGKKKLRKPDDYFWIVPNTNKRISAQLLQEYLNSLTGKTHITLHKFRHARGTRIAIKELEKFSVHIDSNTEKEIIEAFQEAMLKVGRELGHYNKGEVTWRTAVINYVDAPVSGSFFKKANIVIPALIQNELDKLL